jgi:glyoxylase-like metal-dependent hydrolase (beta-lactamase superfamily II)
MANEFIKVSDNVYYMTPGDNDRPALGYIACGDCSVMVDAGNSPAHVKLFLSELKKNNLKYPAYLAITHWHWDHVFGSASIDSKIIANKKTSPHLKYLKSLSWSDEEFDERIKKGEEIEFCRDNMKAELSVISSDMIRLPDTSFDEQMTLGTNNNRCELIHVGGDHSEDSTIVYSPRDKVAFIGDCLYIGAYESTPCYTKDKLISLLNKLLIIDAKIYIDSHEEKPILREDIETFQKVALEVVSNLREERTVLMRSDFPDMTDSKLCNNLLESWQMFIDYCQKV